MGFTLRAALAVLPAQASVVVAELVPEIIAWARGPMAELTAGCLDDPRVTRRRGRCRRGDRRRSAAPTTRSCSTSTTAPTA